MAIRHENNLSPFADNNQRGANQKERAIAFINFHLPTNSGDSKQLAFGALVASNPDHVELLEQYEKDPEGVLAAIKDALDIRINEANKATGGFALKLSK